MDKNTPPFHVYACKQWLKMTKNHSRLRVWKILWVKSETCCYFPKQLLMFNASSISHCFSQGGCFSFLSNFFGRFKCGSRPRKSRAARRKAMRTLSEEFALQAPTELVSGEVLRAHESNWVFDHRKGTFIFIVNLYIKLFKRKFCI